MLLCQHARALRYFPGERIGQHRRLADARQVSAELSAYQGMGVVDQILALWRKAGVRLNVGADAPTLDALERLVGCALPDELRQLYLQANGMQECEMDTRHVSVWSIEKVLAHASELSETPAFADFLIDSWYFRFGRVGSSLAVFTENVMPGSPLELLGSFPDFLTKYVHEPDKLGLWDDQA